MLMPINLVTYPFKHVRSNKNITENEFSVCHGSKLFVV